MQLVDVCHTKADGTKVSIPQAVGTIAIHGSMAVILPSPCTSVSIPQAVGTIAIINVLNSTKTFRTVSIPQAVGTIAIAAILTVVVMAVAMFQYRKR